ARGARLQCSASSCKVSRPGLPCWGAADVDPSLPSGVVVVGPGAAEVVVVPPSPPQAATKRPRTATAAIHRHDRYLLFIRLVLLRGISWAGAPRTTRPTGLDLT